MKKVVNKKILLLGISIVFASFVFLPVPTSAQLIAGSDKGYESGDYELNDALVVGVRATQIILGLVGSLALLFFVYGGVMFLISAGNSEQVQKAKGIVVNAVIGLIIVFMSWIIIQFTMEALGVKWKGTSDLITKSSPLPSSSNTPPPVND